MTDTKAGLSDEQLALRVQKGDDAAFAMLIERALPMLRAQTALACSRQSDRDDLAQEALLGLLFAAKRFSPERGASFLTFARVCVRHRLCDAAKALSTAETPQEDAVLFDEMEKDDVAAPASPDRILVSREEEETLLCQLRAVLSELEFGVLLRHLSAYSYKEIAVSLDISEKAVDNALCRIRRKLSDFF